MKRRLMAPGDIFGVEYAPGRKRGDRSAFVVLDARTEVNFWTGVVTKFGALCPSASYEVLNTTLQENPL